MLKNLFIVSVPLDLIDTDFMILLEVVAAIDIPFIFTMLSLVHSFMSVAKEISHVLFLL